MSRLSRTTQETGTLGKPSTSAWSTPRSRETVWQLATSVSSHMIYSLEYVVQSVVGSEATLAANKKITRLRNIFLLWLGESKGMARSTMWVLTSNRLGTYESSSCSCLKLNGASDDSYDMCNLGQLDPRFERKRSTTL